MFVACVCVSDLGDMRAALGDEEVGGSLGGPQKLCQAWLNLLVQEADPLPEHTQLPWRQSLDDPVTRTRTHTHTHTHTHTADQI